LKSATTLQAIASAAFCISSFVNIQGSAAAMRIGSIQMGHFHENIVRVIHNPHGWWDVKSPAGDVIVRFVSEFQAVEAGRMEADRLGADLEIQRHEDPALHEARGTARTPGPVSRPAAAPPVALHARSRRPLILLVEDRVDSRELYAEYLAYAGFSVVTAINGHEGLRIAAHLVPDLILMDLRMPGMDGFEATADLKADPRLAHIPVVAITADLSADIFERARAAGCTTVIEKPALPDEVARRITEILDGKLASSAYRR
jgi:two-component system, cell cycle response regulator DivK